VSNGEYSAQLIAVGKELYNRRLQTTRSGNISIRDGERFLITQTGANLGQLLESNLIHVDISQDLPIPPEASCESPLHRAIYNAVEALAIVHAHPIHAIALAQISCDDHILPIHNEGLAGLKRIPILDTSVPGLDIGEEPTAIAAALRQSCSVVVRGHGAFAIGRSLDQAFYRMLLLEDTCQINLLVHDHLRSATTPKAPAVLKSARHSGARRLVRSD
jgi:L-fuculose-phosphate aldolase